GRLFLWDWSRRVYKLATFDADAKVKSLVDFPVTGATGIFGSLISAEYGRDGSLYLLRYSKNGYGDQGNSGGLFKVDYTGPIDEACLPVSVAVRGGRLGGEGIKGGVAGLTGFEIPEGRAGIEIFDLSGRLVHRELRGGRGGGLRVELPPGKARGLVRARVF
ncbi:MAG TPA: hypothetical protein VK465_16345, partial [Fibrobacteria bacterium]|nr:hypothetical protein [Fibrobacteria bacterium]